MKNVGRFRPSKTSKNYTLKRTNCAVIIVLQTKYLHNLEVSKVVLNMEFLHELNTAIRFIELPFTVNAFTVYEPSEDFYNVFVNERLTKYEQEKAILHELEHIRKGHFTTGFGRNVSDIEWEMNALWHQETTQTTHCSGSLGLCG